VNRAAEQTVQELEQAGEDSGSKSQALQQANNGLRFADAQLEQSRRQGNQVWLAFQDVRNRLRRIAAHSDLGLALKGRGWPRRTISRITPRLHVE
jgi:hypothetical protein